MFAIEEGASSLHQDLLWRFLFTSFLAFMVLKEALTLAYGRPGTVYDSPGRLVRGPRTGG